MIAKGQENFESLGEAERNRIFYLFMAKGGPIANMLGAEIMSIVCAKKISGLEIIKCYQSYIYHDINEVN